MTAEPHLPCAVTKCQGFGGHCNESPKHRMGMPEPEILLRHNKAMAHTSRSTEALQLNQIFFARNVALLKCVMHVFFKSPEYIIVFQSCNIMCLTCQLVSQETVYLVGSLVYLQHLSYSRCSIFAK